MSDPSSKPKKPIYKRWWFWLLAIVVLILIASSGGKGNNASQGGTQAQQAAPTASQGQQEAKAEPTWQAVKAWKGNGIKKTEPFTISGKQWRVLWKNGNGYLGVTVYKPGSSLPTDMLVNTSDPVSDTSYVYKSGEFYLDVNATGSWEITVEELK